MTVLKYWDVGSSSYKVLTGPPGPANPYIVVADLTMNPPNVNAPPVNPPNGLLVADTSVPDPTAYYLPLAGGTLTGALSINPASGSQALTLKGASGGTVLTLNKPGSGTENDIIGQTNGSARWMITLGTITAESGGNVGSDCYINRYSDAGTLIDTPLTITRSTGQVAIKGTSTNDNAAAGMVGEVISSSASGVSLNGSTAANVTSISLTPGDWDVMGEVGIIAGTGGPTTLSAGINTISGSIPSAGSLTGSRYTLMGPTFQASATHALPLRTTRASLAVTTTYYLVALAVFVGGTTTAQGIIWARRMR